MTINNLPLCLGHAIAARGRMVRRGVTMSTFHGDVLQLLKEPVAPNTASARSPVPVAKETPPPGPPPAPPEEPPAPVESVEPKPAAPAQPPLEAEVEAALTTLANNPAFDKVDYQDLVAIGRQAHRRRVLEGRVLVRQGDQCDRVYVLLNGAARMERPRKGRTPVVSRFAPGEVIGAVGLLHGGRYTATVSALEDQKLLELTQEDVASLFRERPALRQAFRRILHSRVALQ